MNSAIIFELLKKSLKIHKKTYKDLARYLDVSELTVKRIFKEKDCKISRMLEICNFLNVNFQEVLEFEKRYSKYPEYLPEETEKALADDAKLFGVFLFIISNLETKDLLRVTRLNQVELYKILRKLDSLKLIDLGIDNHFTIKTHLPVAWRLNGALSNALKKVNLKYLSYCFENHENPDYNYFSTSRLMSADSAHTIKNKLDELYQSFHLLATQDQLFCDGDSLRPYKLQIAHGLLPVDDIFFTD